MKSGPIIVLEDDADDHDILEAVLEDLNITNKIVWFTRADEAFDYLNSTSDQPFIIFSDVNLPGQNGLEFKRRIDAHPYLREKSIPFVFYSTAANEQIIKEAYTERTVQGFFQKTTT